MEMATLLFFLTMRRRSKESGEAAGTSKSEYSLFKYAYLVKDAIKLGFLAGYWTPNNSVLFYTRRALAQYPEV